MVAQSRLKESLAIAGFALLTLFAPAAATAGSVLSQVIARDNGTLEQHIVVEGRRLVFRVPSAYCVLDRSREWDRFNFETMSRLQEPKNTLLAYWINCRDYERLRAGDDVALGRYVLIQGANGAHGNLYRRGVNRKAMVESVVQEVTSADFGQRLRRGIAEHLDGKEFDALIGEKAAAAARDGDLLALERTQFNALVKQLGEWEGVNVFPLGRDENAAYVGFAIPDGRTRVAGVAAITLINGIYLTFNIYDVPASAATYRSLKKTAGIMTNAAIDATGDQQADARGTVQTWWDSIELPSYVRSGIIGAIVAVLLSAFFRFVRNCF